MRTCSSMMQLLPMMIGPSWQPDRRFRSEIRDMREISNLQQTLERPCNGGCRLSRDGRAWIATTIESKYLGNYLRRRVDDGAAANGHIPLQRGPSAHHGIVSNHKAGHAAVNVGSCAGEPPRKRKPSQKRNDQPTIMSYNTATPTSSGTGEFIENGQGRWCAATPTAPSPLPATQRRSTQVSPGRTLFPSPSKGVGWTIIETMHGCGSVGGVDTTTCGYS